MKYQLKQISKVARQIVKEIDDNKATIVAMEGELGAGKTALTKVLAKILGIKEDITSPTFVLSVQYTIPKSQRKLEHIDLWRMEEFGELEQIGLQKMIEEKSIIVVEWADKFKSKVKSQKSKAKLIWVKIKYGEGEEEREIEWEVV